MSEFFPDELALLLNCSRAAATTLAEVSVTLTERLPATWAALADGKLDWPRARALALELGWPARETEPAVIAEVEAAVLPSAMDLSVKRLRALVARELISRDSAAADRRRKRAERAADVTLHGLGAGLSELRAVLPAPLAPRPGRSSTAMPAWPKLMVRPARSASYGSGCWRTSSCVPGTRVGRPSPPS